MKMKKNNAEKIKADFVRKYMNEKMFLAMCEELRVHRCSAYCQVGICDEESVGLIEMLDEYIKIDKEC